MFNFLFNFYFNKKLKIHVMKKLLLVFVLTFIGCSGDNDSENNNSNNPVFENVLTIDGTYPFHLLNYGGQH